MHKEIVKIEFIMENTECIEIERRYLGRFQINDIRKNISVAAKAMSRHETCDHFSMAAYRSGDEVYGQFGDDSSLERKYNRLKVGDIVSINIIYDDQTEEEVYVTWTGESNYKNESQNTYINNYGDLFIVINKNKKIEEEFNFDLDDEASLDYMLFSNC
ncbi:hypothetical protein NBRC13296_12685 [Paenibacillus chitinolyticus]|uniref:hypothetical protein n=1 Tax=Paenibacillus chitinolyticus TaxID=79263 RepID=UPI0035574CCB